MKISIETVVRNEIDLRANNEYELDLFNKEQYKEFAKLYNEQVNNFSDKSKINWTHTIITTATIKNIKIVSEVYYGHTSNDVKISIDTNGKDSLQRFFCNDQLGHEWKSKTLYKFLKKTRKLLQEALKAEG